MKKSGDIKSFIEAVEASARLGNQYIWEIDLELPETSGKGYARGGKLIYLQVGNLKGNEALKTLKRYDKFAYSFGIYEGEVPEIQNIDVFSILFGDITPIYETLPISTLRGNFVDVIRNMENEGYTGLIFFNDDSGNEILASVFEGKLTGVRFFGNVGITKRILENVRMLSTDFYIMQFKDISKIQGFIYGIKSITDIPGSQWDADKLRKFNGTIEVSRGFERILVLSNGKEILTIFKLSVPPKFDKDIGSTLFQKGNLVSAYPETAPNFIFSYTFKESQDVMNLFSTLVSESRKIVGEIIFKRAADKVLKFSLPPKPYPDEVVETLKNIFSIYEKEISAFTGKKWKEIKSNILANHPENIAKVFQ